MIKTYMRQALTLIKQNKLYSTLYIIGTGLSVALIMMVSIVYYIKFAPIYPEYNRGTTMVMKSIAIRKTDGMCANQLSYHFCSDVLAKMKHVKDVAMINMSSSFINDGLIMMGKGKENIAVQPMYVNDGFWRVFTFNFISGRPFTSSDERAHLNKAVISESLAKKIFGNAAVVGKTFENNGCKYEVSGVVKDVSAATPVTYADLWLVIPKSAGADSDAKNMPVFGVNLSAFNLIGFYYCYMTVAEAKDEPLLKDEIETYFNTLDRSVKKDSMKFDLTGQPDTYIENSLRMYDNIKPNYKQIVTDFLIMMFALLFVPALNQCGMIASSMDGRMCEMGIRKAFGGRKRSLLNQILCENLILTAAGAVLGLLLSYIMVYLFSGWIVTLFDTHGIIGNTNITFEMLFNPLIVGIAIVVCLILNLISALVPALLSLRHGIIYSLNSKR